MRKYLVHIFILWLTLTTVADSSFVYSNFGEETYADDFQDQSYLNTLSEGVTESEAYGMWQEIDDAESGFVPTPDYDSSSDDDDDSSGGVGSAPDYDSEPEVVDDGSVTEFYNEVIEEATAWSLDE